ncbi:hypothetical protein QYM36_003458 [Artemia franciscana]|uniref:Exportin-T n=1 Tax=Artemia franciscana TaxID=6661 RepID=A0AA88I3P9_ARTSF|nr:hypothetical protein QYM36_003458 [Artemia franciscana]
MLIFTAQKDCYSILKKLVELWGNNGPPDFDEFLYNQIVPACFLGPLRETFDLSDAQTLLALNEASACLKLIYDQKGEEAIEFLQSQYLPRLDFRSNYFRPLPAPKILEFCQALRMEAKLFKQFLKVSLCLLFSIFPNKKT